MGRDYEMRHKVKNTVLALFCSILFVCAAAFALCVFDMSESKIARAENGATVLADAAYTELRVETDTIYATDTSSSKIKQRLHVYGKTSADAGEALLGEDEYEVYFGGTTGEESPWVLSTSNNNTFTVKAGEAETSFTAIARQISLDRIEVTPSFTASESGNTLIDGGSVLELYSTNNFASVKNHITVVAFNNDGRPYDNGRNGVLSAGEYTITGGTSGYVTLTLSWNSLQTSFYAYISEDTIVGLSVVEESIPQEVSASDSVNNATFSELRLTAEYASGSTLELQGDMSGVTFSGFFHSSTAQVGDTYQETVTVSYGSANTEFSVTVRQVAVQSIMLMASSYMQYGDALGQLDVSGIGVTIFYAEGNPKFVSSGLTRADLNIVYVDKDGEDTDRDYFMVGDQYAEVTFTEAGISSSTIEIELVISAITVSGPTFDSGSVTFTGEEQSKSLLSGFDSSIMEIRSVSEGLRAEGDAVYFTNANESDEYYSFHVYLTNQNYTWYTLGGLPTGAFAFGSDDGGEYIEYHFTVNKLPLNLGSISLHVSGWTFGDSPVAPYLTGLPEGIGEEAVTYYYYAEGESSDNATTEVPQNADTYYVYAVISETTNYRGGTVDDIQSFVISKKTLEDPKGLDQEYNEKNQTAKTETLADYGTIFIISECEEHMNVGQNYTVTFRIQDEHWRNYQWRNESQTITCYWAITVGQNEISQLSHADSVYGEELGALSYTLKFKAAEENVTVEYYKDGASLGEGVKPTEAGEYTVRVTIASTNNYNGTYEECSFVIARAQIAQPSVSGSYTYNGEEQNVQLKWINGSEDVTITPADAGDVYDAYFAFSGNLSARNASNSRPYSLTITLNSNYCWTGGAADALVLEWTIARAPIAKPELTGAYTYDGTKQNVQLKWNNGSKDVTITPADAGDVYDAYFAFSGDLSAQNVHTAGGYTLVASLNFNYCWTGGDTGDLQILWNISQAQNSFKKFNMDGWEYLSKPVQPDYAFEFPDGAEPSVTYYYDANGNGEFEENEKLSAPPASDSDAGFYKVVVTLKDTGNYLGTEDFRTFTVARKAIGKPAAKYGDAVSDTINSIKGYVYTGEEIVLALADDQSGTAYTVSGNTGTDAGAYKAVFILNKNYRWDSSEGTSDGTAEGDYTLTWHIVAKKVSLPAFEVADSEYRYEYSSGYKRGNQTMNIDGYSADAMSAVIAAAEGGSCSVAGGLITVLDADTYTITVSLNNSGAVNYVWDDGNASSAADSGAKKLKWTVLPEKVSAPVLNESSTVYQDTVAGQSVQGQEQSVTLTDGGDAEAFEVTFTGTRTALDGKDLTLYATDADTYTVTVRLKSGNFTWDEGDTLELQWTIAPKPVSLADTGYEGRLLEFNSDAWTEWPSVLLAADELDPRYELKGYYRSESGGFVSEGSKPSQTGSYYIAFELISGNYVWKKAAGDQGTAADETDTVSDPVIYAWFKITLTRYLENVEASISGWTYGDTEQAPSVTFDLEADPNLSEVQAAEKTYYYSGTTRGGAAYGKGDDDESGEGYGTTTVPTEAGTYNLIIVIAETMNYAETVLGTGLGDNNPEIEFTITPKLLTDQVWRDSVRNAYSFEYGSAQAAQFEFRGAEPGDLVPVFYEYVKDGESAGESYHPINAGDYTVYASVRNMNYCLTQDGGEYGMTVTADYAVTRKTITVSVEDQTVVYGEALSEWTVNYGKLVYDGKEYFDTAESLDFYTQLDIDCAYEPGAEKGSVNGGPYAVTLSGLSADNYTIQYSHGKVTVIAREIVVTIEDGGHKYGEESFGQLSASAALSGEQAGASGDAILSSDSVSDVYSLAVSEEIGQYTPAATYFISGEDRKNPNYSVRFVRAEHSDEQSAEYIVSPADITWSDYAYSETYNAQSHTQAIIGGAERSIALENEEANSGSLKVLYSTTGSDYSDTLRDFRNAEGPVTVYVKITADNHNEKTVQFTVEIGKAKLSVSVEGVDVEYGNDAPGTFTLRYKGLFEDAADGQITGTAQFAHEYAPGAAAGSSFPVTVSGLASDNYAINFDDAEFNAEGKITVIARKIAIEFSEQTQEYKGQGGEYTLDSSKYTLTGGTSLYQDDDPGVHLIADLTSNNAGSYKIMLDTSYGYGSGASANCGWTNGNYHVTVSNPDNKNFTITKKTVTVEIGSHRVDYGESAPDLGWGDVFLVGFADGSAHDAQLGTPEFEFDTYQPNAQNGAAGSKHTITLISGTEFANYILDVQSGTLAVDQKEITVVIEWNGESYTGEAQYAEASVAEGGLIAGDAGLNVPGNFGYKYCKEDGSEAEPIDAGKYTVTVTLGEALSNNYKLMGDDDYEFTIGSREIDVVWAHEAQAESYYVYDGADHRSEITATAKGVGREQDTVYTLSVSGRDDFEAAGTYSFTAAFAPSDRQAANNYTLTGAKIDYVITRRSVTIQANNASMYYAEEPDVVSLGYTYAENSAEFVADDSLTFEYGTTATDSSAAGSYTTSVSVGGSDSANYSVECKTGVMNVLPRPIIVTIDDKTSAYGSDLLADPTSAAQIGAAADGMTLSDFAVKEGDTAYTLMIVWNTEEANKPVGTYDIVIDPKQPNANYAVTVRNTDGKAAYIVTQRPVTVTPNENSAVYGEAVTDGTVSYMSTDDAYASAFAPGENAESVGIGLTFAYRKDGADYQPGAEYGAAGNYTITVSVSSSLADKFKNYTFTAAEGTLRVEAREITVLIASNINTVYGAEKDLYALHASDVNISFSGTQSGRVTGDAIVAGDEKSGVFSLSAYSAALSQTVEFGLTADQGVYYIVGAGINANYIVSFSGDYTDPVTQQEKSAGMHTVGQKPVSFDISGLSGDHPYTGRGYQVTADINEDDIVTGDVVDFVVQYAPLGTQNWTDELPVNAGTYDVRVYTEDANYLPAVVSSDLIISPRTIKVVWEGAGRAYDGQDHIGEIKAYYYQWVGGSMSDAAEHRVELAVTLDEYYAYVNGAISSSPADADTYKDAGRYIFIADFKTEDGNYKLPDVLSQRTAEYEIARAELVVKIENKTGEYGDDIAALTCIYDEASLYDAASDVFSLSTDATKLSPANGNYHITGTAAGPRSFNYDIDFRNAENEGAGWGVYTITPRVLLVSVAHREVEYGTAKDAIDEGFTLHYERKNAGTGVFADGEDESKVNKDGVRYTYTYTAGYDGTQAGTRVAVTAAGLTAANYAFEYVTYNYDQDGGVYGGFTVIRRTVTLKDSYESLFSGLEYENWNHWQAIGEEHVNGLVFGETVGEHIGFEYTVMFSKTQGGSASTVTQDDVIGAGYYTVSIAQDDAVGANYLFEGDSFAFTVAKAELTITVDADDGEDGLQPVTVRYGNELPESEIIENVRVSGVREDDEEAFIAGIKSALSVSHEYRYTYSGGTPTAAGSTLNIKLAHAEFDNYVFANAQEEAQGYIQVLRREISVTTNAYENGNFTSQTIYGMYDGGILPADEALAVVAAKVIAVPAGGLVTGEQLEDIGTFAYTYFGTSYDSSWSYTAESPSAANPVLPGTYTVRIALTSGNYTLASGAAGEDGAVYIDMTYRILKQRADAPRFLIEGIGNDTTQADGSTYIASAEFNPAAISYKEGSASASNGGVILSSGVVGGNTFTMSASVAGRYSATFVLQKADNYVWFTDAGEAQPDSAEITVSWSLTLYGEVEIRITSVTINGTKYDIGEGVTQLPYELTYGESFGADDIGYEATFGNGQTYSGSVRFDFNKKIGDRWETASSYFTAGVFRVCAAVDDPNYGQTVFNWVEYTVRRKALDVPTAEDSQYAHGVTVSTPLAGYDGSTMRQVSNCSHVTLAYIDGAWVLQGNIVSAEHYIVIALTDTENYCWNLSDGSASTEAQRVGWTIQPFAVTAPVFESGFESGYTGSTITYTYTDSEHRAYYSVSGTSGIDAGTYTATATLRDPLNYVWAASGTAPVTMDWKITKAANEWLGSYARSGWTYGEDPSAETLPSAAFGTPLVEYFLDSDCSVPFEGEFENATDAGTYYVRISVAGTDNYEGIEYTYGQSFEISPAEVSVVWNGAEDLVYDAQEKKFPEASYQLLFGAGTRKLTVTLNDSGKFADAGDYTFTAAFSAEDTYAKNYKIVSGAETVRTISPARVTVEVEDQTAEFTGEPVSADASKYAVRGELYGQDLGITLQIPADSVDAGTYAITADWTNKNFDVTFTRSALFTITPIDVNVVITPNGGAYGSASAAEAYAVRAGQSEPLGIEVTLTYAGTPNGGTAQDYGKQVPENAGSYIVTASIGSRNYQISGSNTAAFIISRAYVEVGAIASKEYNGETQTADISVEGAAAGVYEVENNGGIGAGSYEVVFAFVGGSENNYVWFYNGAEVSAPSLTLSFVITAAQNSAEITDAAGWTYGDAAAVPVYRAKFSEAGGVIFEYSAVENGTYTQTVPQNAGEYWVRVRIAGTANYSSATSAAVRFEIGRRSVAKPVLSDPADAAIETGDTLHNEIVGFDGSVMRATDLESGITETGGKTYLTAAAAGVYRVTIHLADTANYSWADGTDGAITLEWTLRLAELESWTAESESRYPDVIVTAAGGLHPDYVLTVASIDEAGYGEYDLSAYENAEIVRGYDISLMNGETAVQPDGEITVRIRLTDALAAGGHTLLHLHGGAWTEIEYTMQDGYAVFTTDSLSDFLFITQGAGESSIVWVIVVLACLLAAEIVVMAVAIAKRRKGRSN